MHARMVDAYSRGWEGMFVYTVEEELVSIELRPAREGGRGSREKDTH